MTKAKAPAAFPPHLLTRRQYCYGGIVTAAGVTPGIETIAAREPRPAIDTFLAQAYPPNPSVHDKRRAVPMLTNFTRAAASASKKYALSA